jgi:hypothetical protein
MPGPYSINSSARAKKVAGTSRSIALRSLRSDDKFDISCAKGMWRASKQAQANVIAAIPADHEEFPRIMG